MGRASRPEPLLEHGAVDGAEVDRVAQVLAVEPVVRGERGVLGVEAALDVLAEDEGSAPGAVVGAAAVVPDAAPELGEHQDGHVVRGVVLAQVLGEGGQRPGQLAEEPVVAGQLLGVVVVAPLLGVEDARPQPGGVHPGDVPQAAGDGAGAVLHRRVVALDGQLEAIGAVEHALPGLAQVVGHQPGADGRGVHPLEDLQVLLALRLHLDPAQQAVGVQVVHRGGPHAGGRQGAGQAAPEADRGEGVGALGVELAHHPGEPALGGHFLRLAGVPDVQRPEVGAAGVLVADALHDGDVPFAVQLAQGAGRGVEAEGVRDGQHLRPRGCPPSGGCRSRSPGCRG